MLGNDAGREWARSCEAANWPLWDHLRRSRTCDIWDQNIGEERVGTPYFGLAKRTEEVKSVRLESRSLLEITQNVPRRKWS
ncbi:hypothetical protein L596_014578 [Steinernema carpocapsae]|uniref:Uncharacterized protein n=1 Tax=Steinernema carpocapsae TaxID=34508 RepID=A0A4V6A2U4_STECR|nr:hypothetical protein L596_014578 [Steinernema carpocapsae]